MLSYIGDHYLYIPLAAALLFMAVVGYVSIESSVGKH